MAGKAGGIRAGGAFVELSLRDRIGKGLSRASAKLRSFSRGVGALGAGMIGLGAGIMAPLQMAVSKFSSVGDQLDKTSKRTGVTVEALSELGFAAEQSGAGLEVLERGLFGLSRSYYAASKGSKGAVNEFGQVIRPSADIVDAFAQVGLSMQQLKGMTPDEQLSAVAEGLSKMTDESKKGAIAQSLFGRQGRQLLPLLNEGAAGIRNLREQARALGLTVSTEAAASAAELTDRMNEMWRVAKMGVFTIGSALAPAVIDVVKSVTAWSVVALDWVKAHKDLVIWVAKLAAAVATVGVVLLSIAGLGFVFSGLAAAGSALLTALVAIKVAVIAAFGALISPAAAAVVAIAAVVAAVAKFTTALDEAKALGAYLDGKFSGLVKDLGGIFTSTFQGVRDAIVTGDWEAAGDIVMAGLEAAWLSGVATLSSIWEDLKLAMIETFAGVVVAVHKMWTDLQNKISKLVIELSMRDDAVGAAARAVLGTDLRGMDEDRREKNISAGQQKIRKFYKQLTRAKRAGDTEEVKRLLGEIEKAEQQFLTGRRAGSGEPLDAAAHAQQIIDDATAAAQEGVADYWAGVTSAQRQAAREAGDDARRRAREARGRLEDLSAGATENRNMQEGLDKLKEWGQHLAGLGGKLQDHVKTWGTKVEAGDVGAGASRGTFSAAVASRLGGRNVEDQQLEAQKDIARNTKQIADKPRLAFGR